MFNTANGNVLCYTAQIELCIIKRLLWRNFAIGSYNENNELFPNYQFSPLWSDDFFFSEYQLWKSVKFEYKLARSVRMSICMLRMNVSFRIDYLQTNIIHMSWISLSVHCDIKHTYLLNMMFGDNITMTVSQSRVLTHHCASVARTLYDSPKLTMRSISYIIHLWRQIYLLFV